MCDKQFKVFIRLLKEELKSVFSPDRTACLSSFFFGSRRKKRVVRAGQSFKEILKLHASKKL